MIKVGDYVSASVQQEGAMTRSYITGTVMEIEGDAIYVFSGMYMWECTRRDIVKVKP